MGELLAAWHSCDVTGRVTKVTLYRTHLVLGWVTVIEHVQRPWYETKPTRSTQPCIPSGYLNEYQS